MQRQTIYHQNMIKITQIKIPLPADRPLAESDREATLRKKAAKCLRVGEARIAALSIERHATDARKKPRLFDVYSVLVSLRREDGAVLTTAEEEKKVRALRDKNVSVYREKPFPFPKAALRPARDPRPLIVGSGPAGLFCAYVLAENGYAPRLIERGRSVDARVRDVERFFETGTPDPVSNVQFGEGGAGTFSDGKLYTASKDRDGLQKRILQVFVKHGAPEDILYEANPHIGTDLLTRVIASMRDRIIENGGEVLFETRLEGLLLKTGPAGTVRQIVGISTDKGDLYADRVVLAIGHSARDTFRMLADTGVRMEQKAFAVGLRIAHPQETVNRAMYGEGYPAYLEPAAYKLTGTAHGGRSVYTFCMCPGGYIINASSEENGICVNGMSLRDRGAPFANSAVIRGVMPDDLRAYAEAETDVLAGVRFQQSLEQAAYRAGNGAVPVQMLDAFLRCETGAETASADIPSAAIRGKWRFADVHAVLPAEITRDLADGIRLFDQKLAGFAAPDAFVAGVESRTSSPVRIVRGDDHMSPSVRGLYPCGEGAGYAGGIMSAAADGIRTARAVAETYDHDAQGILHSSV